MNSPSENIRHFFRYAHGYINVDAQGVYFSSTGNWEAVSSLKEKGQGESPGRKFQRIGLIAFMVLVAGFTLLYVFRIAFVSRVSVMSFVAMGITIYAFVKFYNYSITGTGRQFYIPIEKLKKVERYQKELLFEFEDNKGNKSRHSAEGVEGFDLENIGSVPVEKLS